mgnify:CR=1 FL=1
MKRQDCEQLTLFRADSPVSRFPLPGSDEARRMTVTSGLKCLELSRISGPLGENVAGIVNMALDQVCADLESEDYSVQAFIIPACAVDAPHRRDRCAIIGCRALERKHNGRGWRPNSLENSDCVRFGKQGILSQQPRRTKFERDGKDGANADCNGLEEQGMQGLPEKQEASVANGGWWPAEPDVGRISYGVPSRVDRLKCLGNAVVPQQFYPIFRAIADIERGIIHG